MIQVMSLVKKGEIDETGLLRAHELARLVFGPENLQSIPELAARNEQALRLDLWREKLSMSNANIRCITDESAQQTLAISFNYPRESDGLESYHIYIAAIHPSARGQGIFSQLLQVTKEDARAAGRKIVTISTYPDRFPTMYAILSRQGSGWEVVEWTDKDVEGARKVLMKMNLV